MKFAPALVLALLFLPSCAKREPQEMTVQEEWQAAAQGDDWVRIPTDKQRTRFALTGWQECHLVTEEKVDTAVGMLAERPAVALGPSLLDEWVGGEIEGGGVPILLRAFHSSNGVNRVAVLGDAALVRHEALGGFADVHRHPCVTRLQKAPTEVLSDAAYDR